MATESAQEEIRKKLEVLALERDYDLIEPKLDEYRTNFGNDRWLRRYIHRNFKHWLNMPKQI